MNEYTKKFATCSCGLKIYPFKEYKIKNAWADKNNEYFEFDCPKCGQAIIIIIKFMG